MVSTGKIIQEGLLGEHYCWESRGLAATELVCVPLWYTRLDYSLHTAEDALSPVHCPLCAFQSAFWQAAPQYAATAHTEHFFSDTPFAPHDQQSFFPPAAADAGG